MNPVFEQIILVAIPILLPPLVGAVIFFVNAQLSKLPANQRVFVQQIVGSSVAAVEQSASGQLNDVGKKQLAIQFVEAELKHWNINIPESIVSSLIEEAVAFLPKTNTPEKVVEVAAPVPATAAVDVKKG